MCDCGVAGAAEWRGPTGHGRGGGHFEYRHATQWGRAQCGSGVADGWQADGIGVNRWLMGGLGRNDSLGCNGLGRNGLGQDGFGHGELRHNGLGNDGVGVEQGVWRRLMKAALSMREALANESDDGQ